MPKGSKSRHRYGLVPLIMLVAVLASEHIVHRIVHDGAPTFVHLANTSGSEQNPLTVSFPGLRTDDEILTRPFHEFWQQQGGALLVRFNPYYFNRYQTIQATYDELIRLGITRVILNLTSMGGRVGTDLIDYIRKQGNHIEVVGVVLKDPPMTGGDIQGKEAWLGWIASIIPGGNITNVIYQRLKGDEHPPPPEMLGPGVDRTNLEAHWQAMSKWPFSGITSEARSVYWRTTIEPGAYSDIPMVVVRASHDTLVLPDTQPWLDAFDGGTVIQAESPGSIVMHAGFTEAPTPWLKAEIAAYSLLPQA